MFYTDTVYKYPYPYNVLETSRKLILDCTIDKNDLFGDADKNFIDKIKGYTPVDDSEIENWVTSSFKKEYLGVVILIFQYGLEIYTISSLNGTPINKILYMLENIMNDFIWGSLRYVFKIPTSVAHGFYERSANRSYVPKEYHYIKNMRAMDIEGTKIKWPTICDQIFDAFGERMTFDQFMEQSPETMKSIKNFGMVRYLTLFHVLSNYGLDYPKAHGFDSIEAAVNNICGSNKADINMIYSKR